MAKNFSMKMTLGMQMKQVTAGFKKTGSAVSTFSKKMTTQIKKADFSAKKLGRTLSRIGSKLKLKRIAQVGFAALGIGVGLAAREFVRFDDAIFGATARFKAAEKPGADMAKVMDNLRQAARKVGAETQFTAAQAADGLNKFALAGFNSEEAIKSLRSQVDLATVTGEDFMMVADISTDLLGGFGGAALESAEKIEKLKEMNALLAVGTLSANVTMESLFDTLKTAAPILTSLGQPMKDVIATASVLGSAGIKGTKAATAMQNVFLRIAAPTKEVSSALAELGLAQKDFVTESGKMKGAADVFSIIGEKTKGLSDVKVVALFKALTGMRGIAGASVLSKNIAQIREQMLRMGKDPQAVMKQTSEFMRQSLGNRLKTLGSAATEMGFKFFEAFNGDAKDGISNITKAVSNFDMKPIVEGFRSVLPVLKDVWFLIKSVVDFLIFISPVIKFVFDVIIFVVKQLIKEITQMKDTTMNSLMTIKNGFFAMVDFIKTAFFAISGFIITSLEFIKTAFFAMTAVMKTAFFGAVNFMKTAFFDFVFVFSAMWFQIIDIVLFAAMKVGEALGLNVSKIQDIKTEIGTIQADIQGRSSFASPESRAIASGNKTVTQNGEMNISIGGAGVDRAEVSSRGGMPTGLNVELGEG